MKKRGFTLIEIIISLVLIVSIGLITIISLNNKTEKDAEKDKKELETAVDVVSEKLRSDNSLREFVISEDDDASSGITSYFCLTKETLISKGIIREDNEILKGIKDDEYFKVSQDQVGTYVYEHPVKIEDCTYIKSTINNKDFANTEEQVIDNLSAEENGYYLSQLLVPKENVDNTYEFKMNFKFNTGKLDDVSFRPDVYTVFIVDASGSMCNDSWSDTDSLCKSNNSKFQKAMDAAKALSSNLTSVNSPHNTFQNYVFAISFASSVGTLPSITLPNFGFKTTELVNSDFYFVNGGTNYNAALTSAYNRIKDIDLTNSRVFVIFLTDGLNNGGSYNTPVNNIKNFLKPSGSQVEYGKLITVGFDYTNSTLISIASSNCKGEGTNCYYTASSSSSSTDNILTVFSGFLEVIEREVMCSTYKKANISIELSENFKFSDDTNLKVIEENLECNEEDFTNNIQTQKLIDNALYDLTFLKPDKSSLEVGTHEFSIINKISIKFYDADNNEVNEILLNKEDFPTVKLDIDNISVVN